jgi:enamine deaminase RidA (YjgF/YER057c/UK114 family)
MRVAVNPSTIAPPVGQYSQCVVASGRLIFIAGQVALAPDGKLVGRGDAAVQSRQILKNIQAIMESQGGRMEDIVTFTIYDTDIAAHAEATRAVRAEFWPSNPPAGTKVQVSKLAHADYLLEINAVGMLKG